MSWETPPDLGSRRPGIGPLLWFGLVGLWLGLFPVAILNLLGDCGGPEEVCIEASRERTEAFLVTFVLVMAASGAALLTVISQWRIWWMLLAAVSTTGLVVSLISLQGSETPPQIAVAAFCLAPGFACLLLAVGVALWGRRASDRGDPPLRG